MARGGTNLKASGPASPRPRGVAARKQAKPAKARAVKTGRAGDRRITRALGRRPGESNLKEEILYVSELEFAARGFAGTSLRDIAAKVGVNQALLRYYFGSKQKLFRAACLYRGHEIAAERLRLLDDLESRAGAPPTVEDIVRAYLLPAIAIKREGPRGEAFWRLAARIHFETGPLARDVRRQTFEELTQRYITALQRALPHVDRDTICWRVVFMVGAYFHIITDTSRLETTSGGRLSSKDIDEALRQLTAFITGGLEAPDKK